MFVFAKNESVPWPPAKAFQEGGQYSLKRLLHVARDAFTVPCVFREKYRLGTSCFWRNHRR